MSNVLFAFAPIESDLLPSKTGQIMMGTGLPYIAAYIEKQGHKTEFWLKDTIPYPEYFEIFKQKIETFKPDWVAIQVYSMNRCNSFRLVKYCQQQGIEVIVGGPHVTAMAPQITERYHVTCVIGEGELTVSELVSGIPRSVVKGISWWNGKNVVVNAARELIEDLDSLPWPKHSALLDAEPEQVCASVLTSRGCPMECSFCSLVKQNRNRVRYRNIVNVVDELEYIKKTYPRVVQIYVNDDAFSINPKRVMQFCDELKKRNLGLKFFCAGTVKGCTKEMFAKMEEAGVDHLYIGLENGNQDVLDHANKRIKLSDVEHVFEMAKDYPRFVLSPYLITGLPGETWKSVQDTVDFILKLQRISYAYADSSTIIWAFPGTAVYEEMKENGYINDNFWFRDNPCPNYTVDHSLAELRQMQDYLMNRVSFLRVFTPVGFYTQMTNAPWNVIKFAWYHPKWIKWALGSSGRYMFPRLWSVLLGNRIEKRWDVKE